MTIDWRRIVDLSLGLFGFGFLTDGRTGWKIFVFLALNFLPFVVGDH
jgi:hypothetical protein